MATPAERLAASLSQLEQLQAGGRRVFRSQELTRVHRQRLIETGFLQEVIRGWLIAAGPGVTAGDTTPWFASFWEFCARYSTDRFGDQWHLSPEQSLLLHGESTAIPRQVIVYAAGGTNNTVALPFGTSIYDLRQERIPPAGYVTERNGLRLYTAEAALVRVSESFLSRNPVEARVVLASINDSTDVLRRLLHGGHSTVAGRLAGGFRNVGRARLADELLETMRTAGYDVRETDPFASHHSFGGGPHDAPIVTRLRAMWVDLRGPVIDAFPAPPRLPADQGAYLRAVDESYQSDAYHSLSIEGYQVTPELVERVRSGGWDPDRNRADRDRRDAMAARGYWQAFQLVRRTISEILAGRDPAASVRASYQGWYRELFQPGVTAGLIDAPALAGFRSEPVLIRGSRHVPPRWEAVRDAMPALFDLLGEEPEPAVRAVLGHWLFGYIHPYSDGNGRMARFLMNAMFASGGYPWTIIQVDHRDAYLAAVERASVELDIRPFATFLAARLADRTSR